MPELVIRSFAMIREALGSKRVRISLAEEISSLEYILEQLVKNYPAIESFIFDNQGNVKSNLVFAVNGSELSPEQYKSITIETVSELAILPPAGGG